jgi:hypothetical protein
MTAMNLLCVCRFDRVMTGGAGTERPASVMRFC